MKVNKLYIILLSTIILLQISNLYFSVKNNNKPIELVDTTELQDTINNRQKIIDKQRTNLKNRYENRKNIDITNDESELDSRFESDGFDEFFK